MKESNQFLTDHLDFLQTKYPILDGTRILLIGLQPELASAREYFSDRDVLLVLVDLEAVLQKERQELADLKADEFVLNLGESCLDLALLLPYVNLKQQTREKLMEAMLQSLKSQARWIDLGLVDPEQAAQDIDYLRKVNVRNLLMTGEPGTLCLISALPAKRA